MRNSESDPRIVSLLPTLLARDIDQATRNGLQRIQGVAKARLLATEGDDCLFSLGVFTRDDYPEYQLFAFDHLFEIRRLGCFAREYSMIGFPSLLLPLRLSVEQRFTDLMMSTDEGLGWYVSESGEAATEEAKVMASPRFVQDDLRCALL